MRTPPATPSGSPGGIRAKSPSLVIRSPALGWEARLFGGFELRNRVISLLQKSSLTIKGMAAMLNAQYDTVHRLVERLKSENLVTVTGRKLMVSLKKATETLAPVASDSLSEPALIVTGRRRKRKAQLKAAAA
jgi:hypothetical protein